jgi:hypothetical protein
MFRYSFIADQLLKALTHKYIRRVPKGVTKTGATKYVYYYAGQEGHGKGVAHESELVQGASFAFGEHGKSRYHAHITKVDGDNLTIKYDDGDKKGKEETMTKKEFQALIHGEHSQAIKQAQSKEDNKQYAQKTKVPDLRKPRPPVPNVDHASIKIKRASSMGKVMDAIEKSPSLEDQLSELVKNGNMDALNSILEKLGVSIKPKIDQSRQDSFIMLAGESGRPVKHAIKYKIVEADDIQASHDEETFGHNPKYQHGLQERVYETDMAEQLKVIRNASQLEPAFLVNTNPDAMNGAPVIDDDGLVLGGNSRTMAIKRAYKQHEEKANLYKNYLSQHADNFGFSPDYISTFNKPILVRAYEPADKSEQNMKLLVRQMNEGFTQAMDEKTEISAISRRVTDRTMGALGRAFSNSDAGSVYEVLNMQNDYSQEVLHALMKDGILSNQNMNKYIDSETGRVSPSFAHMLSDVLVGRVIKNKTMFAKISPALFERFSAGIITLVSMNLFDEKNRDALEHAIYAYALANKAGFLKTRGTAPTNLEGLQDWIKQTKGDTGKNDIEDVVREKIDKNPLVLQYMETLGIATTAQKLREMLGSAGKAALSAGKDKEVDLFGETATMEKELARVNDANRPADIRGDRQTLKLKKSLAQKTQFRFSSILKNLHKTR